MTVPRSLLHALDRAWDPLMARLQGIPDAEYAWEPAVGCWTVRAVDGRWQADWADPDPDPAPVTTIAWRCWHVAVDCLESYSARLFGATGTGLAGTEWVGDAAQAQASMVQAWSVFRTGAAGWDDAQLKEPLGPAWGPFATSTHLDLGFHALREIVHHGAEIALLRDLYHRRVAP